MRAAAGLLAVALLAACGSGGGGPLSTDDAEALATRAQLTVKDLGPDWRKTADEAPQAAQLDACIGDLATDTLAESHTRTFERTTDAGSQQLVVSSAVLPTDARAGRLLAKVGTDAFADCITSTFEHELEASDQGVQLDRGEVIRWDEMVHDSIGTSRPQGVTTDGVHPSPDGQRMLGDAEVRALVRCGRPWHYW